MKPFFVGAMALIVLTACTGHGQARLAQENASLAAQVRELEQANRQLHDQLAQAGDAIADAQDGLDAVRETLADLAGNRDRFAELAQGIDDISGALDAAADATDEHAPEDTPRVVQVAGAVAPRTPRVYEAPYDGCHVNPAHAFAQDALSKK